MAATGITVPFRSPAEHVEVLGAAGRLADLGFLAGPDLPDRPGPAYLLVAIREQPTLQHYDPERIQFWVSHRPRDVRRSLTRATPTPIDMGFSWGMIRLVDRLEVSNEYLTFGGHLSAASIDDATVAVFHSPVPLLRRGGHSQLWDEGADLLAAFFGRVAASASMDARVAEDVTSVDEYVRYSAFLADIGDRYRSSAVLRLANAHIWAVLRAEETRMRQEHAPAWRAGERLLAGIRVATSRHP